MFAMQWNDFRENTGSEFGDLRQDKKFTDVTLVSEDGQQGEAYKMVLVALSPFFWNILKRNKHPHPLIYMRGARPESLKTMVDFFYQGEANVYKENLDLCQGRRLRPILCCFLFRKIQSPSLIFFRFICFRQKYMMT